MIQDILTGTPIFDDAGKQVGRALEVTEAGKVGIITETGSRFWAPRQVISLSNERWTLEADYLETSSNEALSRHQERMLDEANAETFPASDPPAFTLGDEGKG